MRPRKIAIVIAVCALIGGCGQQGPQGEPGPAGPPGPAGAAGAEGAPGTAGTQIRVVRSDCTPAACTAACGADEVMISAYCGERRRPANVLSETSISCTPQRPSSGPAVAICAKPTSQ